MRSSHCLAILLAVITLVAAACSPLSSPTLEVVPAESQSIVPTETQTILPTDTQSETPMDSQLTDQIPAGAQSQFSTDFSIHSVPYEEILSGGPPKDGIPAIDNPVFTSVPEVNWLDPDEPVVQIQVGEQARAYPIQILVWHEIVNDEVNGLPLVVTFCPLCNTAIAFERSLDGQVLDFGTTGRLRYSNLIMYDRQTESWWQQANGEAIVGEHTGMRLSFYPALIVSWRDFREAFPAGTVLSRETGFIRAYGNNPYAGYDSVDSSPFLYLGPATPDELPPMARVLTIELDDQAVAFPYNTLKEMGVVNYTLGSEEILVLWQPELDSAFPAPNSIEEIRDVGAAAAFSRVLDGQVLSFLDQDGEIVDEQTGSLWNIFGQAFEGPLKGAQLDQIVSINHFWFSWAAFRPDTIVYAP